MSERECGCSIKAGSFGHYLDRSCCDIDALTAQNQELTEQLREANDPAKLEAYVNRIIDSRDQLLQEKIDNLSEQLAQITIERDQLKGDAELNRAELKQMTVVAGNRISLTEDVNRRLKQENADLTIERDQLLAKLEKADRMDNQ